MDTKWFFLFFFLVLFTQPFFADEDNRYLRYPYLSSTTLKKETSIELYERYEEISNEFISAMNGQIPLEKLSDLFLTGDQLEDFFDWHYEVTEDFTQEDADMYLEIADETKGMWADILDRMALQGVTFSLVEFGVFVEYGARYYFLLQIQLDNTEEISNFPLLAEFNEDKLLIVEMGIEPFVFN